MTISSSEGSYNPQALVRVLTNIANGIAGAIRRIGVLNEHTEELIKTSTDKILKFVIPELSYLRDDVQKNTALLESIKNQNAYLLAQNGIEIAEDDYECL